VHRALDTADRFAVIAERLPSDVSKERQAALEQVHDLVQAERQAAIDQVNQSVSAQRVALTDELTKQTSQLGQIVADVNRLVGNVQQTAASVNQSTSKTIVTTEEASQRTMVLGFRLGLVLILVLIFCPPAALLLYRLAIKRWIAPGAR
jgi:esterase/lipase